MPARSGFLISGSCRRASVGRNNSGEKTVLFLSVVTFHLYFREEKCRVSNHKHPILLCTRHKSGVPHYHYFKLTSFSLKSNVPSKTRALIPELRYFIAKLEARKCLQYVGPVSSLQRSPVAVRSAGCPATVEICRNQKDI